jgi:phosphatidylinositol glycan class F
MERALVYPIVGTLVGAWAGAIPIPLDWDRPWQVSRVLQSCHLSLVSAVTRGHLVDCIQSYPLTLAFASLLGFIAGNYVSWAQSALDSIKDELRNVPRDSVPARAKEVRKKGKKGKTA